MRILAALLISFMLVGCATRNKPFTRMLDKTADYDGKYRAEAEIAKSKGAMFGPTHVAPKLTDVYLHSHEMNNGDYFLGGWIRTVVSHAYWNHSRPTFPKSSPKPKWRKGGSRR